MPETTPKDMHRILAQAKQEYFDLKNATEKKFYRIEMVLKEFARSRLYLTKRLKSLRHEADHLEKEIENIRRSEKWIMEVLELPLIQKGPFNGNPDIPEA